MVGICVGIWCLIIDIVTRYTFIWGSTHCTLFSKLLYYLINHTIIVNIMLIDLNTNDIVKFYAGVVWNFEPPKNWTQVQNIIRGLNIPSIKIDPGVKIPYATGMFTNTVILFYWITCCFTEGVEHHNFLNKLE